MRRIENINFDFQKTTQKNVHLFKTFYINQI